MFDKERYINNSLTIVFTQKNIRRLANSFEDILKNKYRPPLITPIPDEAPPEIPRMFFDSINGFSKIIISNNNINFNVNYSPEWQLSIENGQKYIKERINLLTCLIKIIPDIKTCFIGLTTLVNIKLFNNNLMLPVQKISDLYLKEKSEFNELSLKFSNIINEKYYSNIVVQNYKITNFINNYISADTMLPLNDISETGIQLIHDFNNKYLFNKNKQHLNNFNDLDEIIELNFKFLKDEIKKII